MSKEIIPPGKIKCCVSGILRKDTPEEKIRQDIARSLIEEYAYKKTDMAVEFSIKMGSSRKRVDVVIFRAGMSHEQENIRIISETKRDDIKPSDRVEGVRQLESYLAACPNAEYGLWVGNERIAVKVETKNGRRRAIQVPDIPKDGETDVPRPTKGSLVPAVRLKQVFRRIHNYIYVNQGFQKDKAFEELLKLIFIKVYDEQYDPSLQFYILPGEDVAVLRFRLQAVFKKVQSRYKYIFKGNETLELNDRVLAYVVSELQRFSLVETETDVKGEAYEELVGPNLRGDRGEFFTPRNVCAMTIDMVFSLFQEGEVTSPGSLKVLDPAVGTGGFLIAGVQKLRRLFSERGLKYDKLRDSVREVAETNFFGIDFNPFLVKVSQMNMVMHGDGSSNIVHANSLESPEYWNEEAKRKIAMGDMDIVVTNPPFGTKAIIDNPDILSQFELTTSGSNSSRTALPPEQLFVERCLQFLKPGGILAIVLPDSILSNPGLIWMRTWILEKAYVVASIDLPTETFEPHTGTQTSILILRKKVTNRGGAEHDYRVFMATPDKVGHDRRGNPLFKTTPSGGISLDNDDHPIIDDHLPMVAFLFRDWVKKTGIGNDN